MLDKKCQLPFVCENVRTLSSRIGCINIIIIVIISLLTSHRLLLSTHDILPLGLISIFVLIHHHPSRSMFACIICMCVRARFLLLLFDSSVLSNSNRVKKDGDGGYSTCIHCRHCRSPFFFFFFSSFNMMCNISKPSECCCFFSSSFY